MSSKSPSVPQHVEAVRRVVEAMEADKGNGWNADRWTRMSGYSANYFAAMFKREMGMSLDSFIAKLKFDEAARLLASEPSLKIFVICQRLGYQSVGTFTRAFKMRYGVSPAMYRDNARNNNERSGDQELSSS